MKQRIRTFVAVEIDAAVRAAADELIRQLAESGADVKWVEPENLHVTVKFLGEVDSRQLHQICRAVEAAVASQPPFDLEVRRAGAFPNARRPRTLWLGAGRGGEELAAVAREVDKQLQRLGYPRESRRFHAHLTLGRVRQGGAASGRLAELLAEQAEFQAGTSRVAEAVVFSSQLSRGGPVYEPLGRARLGGG